MAELAVVGAGPAGLMTALVAARAGHDCTVFEAAPRVGGMAASIEVGGQRVDLGSHRLHPSTDPRLIALLTDLLGDDLQTRWRHGRIRLRDRWVAFPLRAADMARNLPAGFTIRATRDALDVVGRRRSGGASFEAEITRRFGPTVADEFYGPYARKLYGIGPGALDAELAQRRVSAGSRRSIVARVLRSSGAAGRRFLYPRRGYGQISEALADAAVAAGAQIVTATAISGVRPRGGPDGGVSLTTGTDRIDVDVVVSTVPRGRLLQITDGVPDAVVAAAGALRQRAMVLVYLVLDCPRFTGFDAHYLPGPETSSARVSEPKNYRDGPDPADTTVICAEIPCWEGDATWTLGDAALAELVISDLHRVDLVPPALLDVTTVRLRSVYPVYERASADQRRTVDGWCHPSGRLLSAGRQGLDVPDNLHHVLAMGRVAGAAIASDGTVDTALWSTGLRRFATHVVED